MANIVKQDQWENVWSEDWKYFVIFFHRYISFHLSQWALLQLDTWGKQETYNRLIYNRSFYGQFVHCGIVLYEMKQFMSSWVPTANQKLAVLEQFNTPGEDQIGWNIMSNKNK